MGRDWIGESAIIARHLPGIGNPLALPIDEFNGYLRSIFDYLKRQAGDSGGGAYDHRSYVEQQMRRLHG